MPSVTELFHQHLAIEEGSEVVRDEQGGPGGMRKVWTFVATDRQSGSQVRVTFGEDTRDELVRQLRGAKVEVAKAMPPHPFGQSPPGRK